MAIFSIHLQTFKPHQAVNLHAWDLAGDVRDVKGDPVTPGSFKFNLEMSAPDLTNVFFKFWYPGESPVWERDDFVRRVPAASPAAVWTVEFSSRCLTVDPSTITSLPAGTVITVGAITANRFAGGRVYAWDPGSDNSRLFPENRRDHVNKISYFSVTLEPWMTSGFHFKLVSSGGEYEPDQANRFWRSIDGEHVFVKSGQVEVRATVPVLTNAPISVTVPRALAANVAVNLRDSVDDFQGDATRTGSAPLDEQFVAVNFIASVFPDAFYIVTPRIDGSEGIQEYRPQWSLPLRLASETIPATKYTLVGVSEWYNTQPTRDAIVDLQIHANPNSTFGAAVEVPWHLGLAPRTQDETPTPVAGTVIAQAMGSGLWTATLKLFGDVPQWIDTLRSAAAVETRADGPILSQRDIRPTNPPERRVFHTIDGQTGVSSIAPLPSLFLDMIVPDRRGLMKSAFSPQIVDAGVFDSHEMPHGATWQDDMLWFVLLAPHAIQASVLLLDRKASRSSAPVRRTIAMNLTADLRYWWCRLPRTELPDPSRVEYRFSVNSTSEVLDPASRQASLAPYVWPDLNEGPEGVWSIAIDRTALATSAAAAGWQTPHWYEFMIYELHAQRFTNRNNGSTSRAPLAQVETELGRYLAALPVTALELLPVNEFPKYISWGYNSSLYFAIESFYGGPSALASLVGTAHRSGKAVLLDVVYNHLTDSPMQVIAKDVFADGETQWGDMVNYDHPACLEFFRQALVYHFDTFRIDGFRFDATQAIVNGHVQNGYIIRDGRVGSGGGREFLQHLHDALHKAATACGRRFPYMVAEHDPNQWDIDGQVVDGQWSFDFLYKVGWAATETGDPAPDLAGVLMTWRNAEETVTCDETHDSCSTQNSGAKRIAARGPWGTGLRMSKACGAITLLAKGVPMFFMGAEAGETKPFFFDVPQSGDVLLLDSYVQSGTGNSKVLAWHRAMLGLRKNWSNGFASNDTPYIGKGNRTIAFTRDGGRFFVIVTFGTPDARQNLGWLGLPQGATYKEIFNSTWPDYSVDYDSWSDNGGYNARLTADAVANLPDIGAVILERT